MDDVSSELKVFLNFVAGGKSEDPFVQQIDKEIQHIKSNQEWRREYMTIQEINQEMKDEGIEIGRKEMIRNLAYELKSASKTAKMLKVDLDEVWKVVKANQIPVEDYPN